MSELLTIGEISAVVKVAERTLRRWDAAGLMPQGIRRGARCVRWRADDIVQWIALGLCSREVFERRTGREE
jgi:predicted DNA-binding transcriptional regulator AlpA